MSRFLLANLYSFSFSMREDSFFMEAGSVGHSSQPSVLRRDKRLWAGEIIAPWKNWGGKSLISIISRISLWVTQHHSNHRGKEMASFHEGWKKKRGGGGWMRGFHSGKSERKHQRKGCVGSFHGECISRDHLSEPGSLSSVWTNMAVWRHALISDTYHWWASSVWC